MCVGLSIRGAHSLFCVHWAASLCVQFEPKRMKPEVLSKVIIKVPPPTEPWGCVVLTLPPSPRLVWQGLMALPAVDYSLCMFFVPERVVSSPPPPSTRG